MTLPPTAGAPDEHDTRGLLVLDSLDECPAAAKQVAGWLTDLPASMAAVRYRFSWPAAAPLTLNLLVELFTVQERPPSSRAELYGSRTPSGARSLRTGRHSALSFLLRE